MCHVLNQDDPRCNTTTSWSSMWGGFPTAPEDGKNQIRFAQGRFLHLPGNSPTENSSFYTLHLGVSSRRWCHRSVLENRFKLATDVEVHCLALDVTQPNNTHNIYTSCLILQSGCKTDVVGLPAYTIKIHQTYLKITPGSSDLGRRHTRLHETSCGCKKSLMQLRQRRDALQLRHHQRPTFFRLRYWSFHKKTEKLVCCPEGHRYS